METIQVGRRQEKLCSGYDADEIFQKVKESILKVRDGEAVYERDSVLFYEKTYNYSLLTYLYQIALMNNKKLNIIDWGGSLGSTFFQNKDLLLTGLEELDWTIKEQEHFVRFGKEQLENEYLHFVNGYDEIENIEKYQTVLFSSVLQYIPDYEQVIKETIAFEPQYIILERTPVGNRKRIWVETVKEPIYNATYPCMMLEKNKLIDLFIEEKYELIDSWKSSVDCDIYLQSDHAEFMSMVFRRK